MGSVIQPLRHRHIILFLLMCTILFQACGGPGEEIPPEMIPVFEEAVDVELVVRARPNAMEYLDTRIEAPTGSRVRLVIDNTETSSPAMIHNVVVISSRSEVERVGLLAQGTPGNIPDDSAILFYTPMASPGTKAAVVFTMPEPGEYPYICTYPGHFQSMQGVLVSTP